jgi:hypothetical protein
MFSFHYQKGIKCKEAYLDAFGLNNSEDSTGLNTILKEGLEIFQNLWGYKSNSIIAPCYIWHEENEKFMFENGVRLIQGMFSQNTYNSIKDKYERTYHYLGEKNNKTKITYSIRNVNFEPTSNQNINWIDKCLQEIEIAYYWGKPAVISSHRVNYVGGIDEKNRDSNLIQLRKLLKIAQKLWPELEFISTKDFINIICAE